MGKGKRGRIRRKGSGLCHLSLCHTPLPNSDPATTALEQFLTCQALAIPKVFLHPLPLLWGIPAYHWVWKAPALPSSLSITSCEGHIPYHLVYDRYPIILLDSILLFSLLVYQSYSVQISLCVYMYNVIFSIDNTVCKEDHWFFTTVVQHTAQCLAQYMVGAQ